MPETDGRDIFFFILLLLLLYHSSYRNKAIQMLGKLPKLFQLVAGTEHSVESTSLVLNLQSVLVHFL